VVLQDIQLMARIAVSIVYKNGPFKGTGGGRQRGTDRMALRLLRSRRLCRRFLWALDGGKRRLLAVDNLRK
jgi:hypothetical protein